MKISELANYLGVNPETIRYHLKKEPNANELLVHGKFTPLGDAWIQKTYKDLQQKMAANNTVKMKSKSESKTKKAEEPEYLDLSMDMLRRECLNLEGTIRILRILWEAESLRLQLVLKDYAKLKTEKENLEHELGMLKAEKK